MLRKKVQKIIIKINKKHLSVGIAAAGFVYLGWRINRLEGLFVEFVEAYQESLEAEFQEFVDEEFNEIIEHLEE